MGSHYLLDNRKPAYFSDLAHNCPRNGAVVVLCRPTERRQRVGIDYSYFFFAAFLAAVLARFSSSAARTFFSISVIEPPAFSTAAFAAGVT